MAVTGNKNINAKLTVTLLAADDFFPAICVSCFLNVARGSVQVSWSSLATQVPENLALSCDLSKGSLLSFKLVNQQ
ncbi:hypothetical protein LINPERHAP2_LOCUS17821 [Linum perenne]